MKALCLISKAVVVLALVMAVWDTTGYCGMMESGTGGMGPGPGGGGGGGGGGTAPGYDSQFTSVHFSGSGNCRMCHNGLTDENGQDVSIETDWLPTIMANGSRDPLWKAKVRTEINRNPHLTSVLNDKCSRCHAPMANTEAHYMGDTVAIFAPGFLDPANSHHNEAMDGISCTLCHQIADSQDLGTLAGFSGHYEIDTYSNPVDRAIYGPYADVFAQPMRNNVSYTIGFSPHIKESQLCATCHNLKTPYVDENGNLLSTSPEDEFPEQMTYSEWEHSGYSNTQSCQQCHMTRADGVIMASRPMWLDTRRNDFAIHDLAGANTLMLDIYTANKAELGVTSNYLAAAMLATENMLSGAAAIEMTQQSLASGILDFTVRVSSFTGHKLPSGIPARRLVLHVAVTDNNGNLVFESGRPNSDGSIAGVEMDSDQQTVEPHFDLITSPGQVQVYESVMEDNTGDPTFILLRGMDYAKDNRLLPVGFDKLSASDDIRVVGGAADDVNFIGGSDDVRYRLTGMTKKRYRVRVELVYQAASAAFVRDLQGENGAEIDTFSRMYNASTRKSQVIAAGEFLVGR